MKTFINIALAAAALACTPGCVVVVTGNCSNGILDGHETDVDCGGDQCGACGVGGRCLLGRDCVTGTCAGGICASPGPVTSCTDGVRNGTETDVDCGGSACPPCGAGRACLVAADCQGQACNGGICTPHPTGAGVTPNTGDIYMIAANQGAVAPAGGYAVTAGTQGGITFRLTGLATSGSQELYGSVFSAGGITAVALGCGGMCSLATTDFVSQPYAVAGGMRVDFDFLSAQSVTGFDLDVTANSQTQPIYFDLLVNGAPSAATQFTAPGGTLRTAASMPFGLIVQ